MKTISPPVLGSLREPQPRAHKIETARHRVRLKSLSCRYRAVLELVSKKTGAPVDLLLDARRFPDRIAHPRQLAMYLLHVVFGLSLTEIGTVLGRDRTTVAHACARVEDRRDDDAFDGFVSSLEAELEDMAPGSVSGPQGLHEWL